MHLLGALLPQLKTPSLVRAGAPLKNAPHLSDEGHSTNVFELYYNGLMARVISRLPIGPGRASMTKPTALSVRLTTPLAQ